MKLNYLHMFNSCIMTEFDVSLEKRFTFQN